MLMLQGRLKALVAEALAHAPDGGVVDLQSLGDLEVFVARVDLEQDARVGQLASRGLARANEPVELVTLLVGEMDRILAHDGAIDPPAPSCKPKQKLY
jgi:hypothetical protein